MIIKSHLVNDVKIAEVVSDTIVLNSAEDGTDLLGNIYYQGFDRVFINEKCINPLFFDLKSGMAGEILQKFSNYRVRLAIVGAFDKYAGKSLKDFIVESNKGRHINFVSTPSDALSVLSS